ncbi:hypothetical protein [Novispirillum itersonii]|uniref:Uncharacterized protein n=1 Tax=Novispirillum itersonii TaxID=189 RepID=A0A7W9ZHS8_NOVIT|nr:hypothetical protein [Novispirillum itersonii]MBB6210339.1 hypothetical protein [Novispirillum itersonii]
MTDLFEHWDDENGDDGVFPIEEELDTTPVAEPRPLLRAGYPIYYSAARCSEPELVIREDPDGTKTLLRVDLSGERVEELEVL